MVLKKQFIGISKTLLGGKIFKVLIMKGIILAGGSGTRLYPLTASVSKQILPIYEKPMIFYPLSVLMNLDIRDILIISTPHDIDLYKNLLSNGADYGVNISYEVQTEPKGLAEAFIIGANFIGNESCTLILGDNIFIGEINEELPLYDLSNHSGALIFGYEVKDPQRYGIVSFTDSGEVKDITEKPENPKSSYAVPGIYIYDNNVIDIAKSISPSNRGELEITDVNNMYLKNRELSVKLMSKNITWLDAGTPDSLHEASSIVKAIQTRTGKKIACLEEIAYKKKWINYDDLHSLLEKISNTEYGIYLKKLLNATEDFKK
jgi:glucose-1-phosphate thymidylyltransferase